ncbi:MAG: spermidine synthase [Nitrospiria bacterium]
MESHLQQNKKIIYVTAFFSGVAGLVYEALWYREFALRLGNTAQASALVLAAIFGGFAVGNCIFGRLSGRLVRPLFVCAVIETGMAFCGGMTLMIREGRGAFALSSLFLLMVVTAVLMGGGLPLLLQSLREVLQAALQRKAPALYGLNTAGGMFGAFIGGLCLPPLIGIRGSFLVAILINLGLGLLIGIQSARSGAEVDFDNDLGNQFFEKPSSASFGLSSGNSSHVLLWLAAFSGFGTLAFEVLSTRMFSLVFQNSVYSFSLILIITLLSLTLAAVCVRHLMLQGSDPNRLIIQALVGVGLWVPIEVILFTKTIGLQALSPESNSLSYLFKMLALTTGLLLPAIMMSGLILPLCWVLDRQKHRSEGWRLGSLLTANTLGGVVGALFSGFFFLPYFGLWQAFGVIAFVYLWASVFAGRSLCKVVDKKPFRKTFATVALVFPVLLFLPVFSSQHLEQGESLLHFEQGAESQVAIIETASGNRILKVNNSYSLGSSEAEVVERRMGQLPLLIHPNAKRVAFVGLATGITASAVYDHPLEKVSVIELLPEVVRGAAWFKKENRGLLESFRNNPAYELIVADGRIALPEDDSLFDLIISDLFVPWHAGASSLYSLEHYQTAARRLSPDGLYAQWLPLYQMSSKEFKIIEETFSKVFPNVSLWRGNFSSGMPIVALIGSKQKIHIDREALATRLNRIEGADPFLATPDDMMLLYAGEMDKKDRVSVLQAGQINTDDLPIIEYLAPISYLTQNRMVGKDLADFFLESAHFAGDWQRHALAGTALYQAAVSKNLKQWEKRVVFLNQASQKVSGSRYLGKIKRALQVSGLVSEDLFQKREIALRRKD